VAIVPDLGKDPATQLAILKATIATWKSANPKSAGYGWIDFAGWQASLEYMRKLNLVPNPVEVSDMVDDTLLPISNP